MEISQKGEARTDLQPRPCLLQLIRMFRPIRLRALRRLLAFSNAKNVRDNIPVTGTGTAGFHPQCDLNVRLRLRIGVGVGVFA